MKPTMHANWLLIATLLAGLGLSSCQGPGGSTPMSIQSPDGQLTLETFIDASGRPGYRLTRQDQVVMDSSFLGYRLQGAPDLAEGFRLATASTREIDETWTPVWGEDALVRNHCQELRLELVEAAEPGRQLNIVFRLFDDGLGFRYEMPAQAGVDSVLITEELTEFALTGDHMAWWIPGDWDIYEHLYTQSRLSEIDAGAKRNHPNLAQTYIPDGRAVNTPVTMKTDDGLYLSFHEAAQLNY
ncbi:MAG: glycoside hydrolase family 97 protein, partial [Bacteroidetes bacterium]